MSTEITEDVLIPDLHVSTKTVAVAVGRGKNSIQAFKWALQNLTILGVSTVNLIHVQAPLRSIRTPLGPLPFDQANEEVKRQAKQEQFEETNKVLQIYKTLCEGSKVDLRVHCAESDSIPEAVAEAISSLGIARLVVGSSSGSKMKRLFRQSRISTAIACSSPEFCTVMVIREGKLVSVKDGKMIFTSNETSNSSDSLYHKNEETDSECGFCNSSGFSTIQYMSPSPSMGFTEEEDYRDEEFKQINEFLVSTTPDYVSGLTLADISRDEVYHFAEVIPKELADVMLQMKDEIRKREQRCATLGEALRISRESSKREIKKHEELSSALSKVQKEAILYKTEAALYRTKLSKSLTERYWILEPPVGRLTRHKHHKYTLYSYEQLSEATNNFSDDQKLGSGGYGNVYKGMLDDVNVAVKILRQSGLDGEQQFQHEVEILSHIQHPNIVLLLGACNERNCIVYEYMENGSLEDRLACKDGMSPLPWYIRFRICFDVATALLFLHNISSQRIVHRDLKPGNILLDHNFVSKLSDAGLARQVPSNLTFDNTVYRETNPAGTFAYMDPEYLRTGSFGPHSDIFALGIIILQLLTGKRPVGVVEILEAALARHNLHEVLDPSAGDWPIPEATELAVLGLQCAEPRRRDRPKLISDIYSLLRRLNRTAQIAVMGERNWISFPEYHIDVVPSFFICPLGQELMVNPHIAADGFTYEYAAIKSWLDENDHSPMTNLKLDNKELVKDSSLFCAIQSWKEKLNIL